jgi:hypothetical protein
MLRVILLLAGSFLFMVPAQGEVRGVQGVFTQKFQYFLQPGIETGLAVSTLSGSAAFHLSPKIFSRLKIELDGMFFSPDVGFGLMTGLSSGRPAFLSAGFTAGYREAPPSVGFYGGLISDSFFGDGQPVGILGRVGIDIDYRVSGAQFFTELRVGGFSQGSGGMSSSSVYYGIHAGLQLLIEI